MEKTSETMLPSGNNFLRVNTYFGPICPNFAVLEKYTKKFDQLW